MAKTLKDLLLALINATLILIALCLFLALQVVNKADAITETFASNLIKLDPVRDELTQIRDDVAGIREQLADIRTNPGELSDAALAQLNARMDQVGARMDTVQATVQEVKQMPYDLTDYAIERMAEEVQGLAKSLADWQRGTDSE